MQMDKNLRKTNLLIEIISLSNPKSRIFLFLFILLILILIPISILEALPNLSICSHLLGKHCYSVGITRGVSSLLKGDFEQSLEYNLLAPLVLLTIIILIVIDLFRLKRIWKNPSNPLRIALKTLE